jgi:hypothetical protein
MMTLMAILVTSFEPMMTKSLSMATMLMAPLPLPRHPPHRFGPLSPHPWYLHVPPPNKDLPSAPPVLHRWLPTPSLP